MAEKIKKPNTYWGSPESYTLKKTLDTLISCVNDLIENGGSGGGESGGESGGSITPLNWELIDTVSNPASSEGVMFWNIVPQLNKGNVFPKAVKIIGTANVETDMFTKLNASTEYLTISAGGNSLDEPNRGEATKLTVGHTEILGNRIEYYFYPDALLGCYIAEINASQEITHMLPNGRTTEETTVKQSNRGFAPNITFPTVIIYFNGTIEDSGSLLRQEGAMTFEIYAAY